MTPIRVTTMAILFTMTVAAGAPAASTTMAPPPVAPPEGAASPPPSTDGRADDESGSRSLDELLGITGDDAVEGESSADLQQQSALELRLSEAEVADAFSDAVRLMKVSMDALGERHDPGIGTQRLQEEIIAKLEILIRQPPKQSSSSGSSSSSSSSASAPRPAPPQQSQGQPGEEQGARRPGEPGVGDPPALEEGPVNSVIDESRVEWGNLPERMRDMIRQGLREEPSSLYQRLTEEYYRRLAEDRSR